MSLTEDKIRKLLQNPRTTEKRIKSIEILSDDLVPLLLQHPNCPNEILEALGHLHVEEIKQSASWVRILLENPAFAIQLDSVWRIKNTYDKIYKCKELTLQYASYLRILSWCIDCIIRMEINTSQGHQIKWANELKNLYRDWLLMPYSPNLLDQIRIFSDSILNDRPKFSATRYLLKGLFGDEEFYRSNYYPPEKIITYAYASFLREIEYSTENAGFIEEDYRILLQVLNYEIPWIEQGVYLKTKGSKL